MNESDLGPTPPATKDAWRTEILTRRRDVDADTKAAEDAALAAAAARIGTELGPDATVCAYVPVGREPGSVAVLDALAARVRRVLLPVAHAPGPLWWAPYRGEGALVPAPFGLREPAPPHLPPETVAAAALLLIPALAVDRRGVRLGRGAGFYDRTLVFAAGRGEHAVPRLIAVVRDAEVVDELPEDPHDVRMREVLTPVGGLRVLGGAE
ncbi:5-formyltetrahydrofolate cyclo-ligase [Rhodococcus sp. NPDC058505]|uniref:5-formyltetrahydrofolate cyclo-ligase n=1 Tax=unclassified Rhodococcus (in: high G+C Gram-positive bacteria) TaxID=192944 RepID=UPI00365A516A